jgi:hypothetical protein
MSSSFATQLETVLFDHLVGASKQGWRHVEAERRSRGGNLLSSRAPGRWSSSPILVGFPLHGRRIRIFHLEPVEGPSGKATVQLLGASGANGS